MTVAPITTTIRGLSTEVALGTANGLEDLCVIACDHITTIRSLHYQANRSADFSIIRRPSGRPASMLGDVTGRSWNQTRRSRRPI